MVARRNMSGPRSRERGAAVFIVVLLVAMLTAVGFFAAQAASLSTISSGHARQSTQARYLAEVGQQTAATYFGGSDSEGPAQIQQARNTPGRECDVVNKPEFCCFGVDTTKPEPYRCVRLRSGYLENKYQPFVVPPAAPLPGSLGWADLDYDIRVEVTDLGRLAYPLPPGMNYSDNDALGSAPRLVTLLTRAIIYPAPTGGMNEDQVIAASGIQALLSGHVTVDVPK